MFACCFQRGADDITIRYIVLTSCINVFRTDLAKFDELDWCVSFVFMHIYMKQQFWKLFSINLKIVFGVDFSESTITVN